MATFILKIDGAEIALQDIHDQTLRKSFSDLQTTIREQVQGLSCSNHHQEPVIILQSEGGQTKVVGLSACCRESCEQIQISMKLPDGGSWVTRTMQYTDHH